MTIKAGCVHRTIMPFVEYNGQVLPCCHVQGLGFEDKRFHLANGQMEDILTGKPWDEFTRGFENDPHVKCQKTCSLKSFRGHSTQSMEGVHGPRTTDSIHVELTSRCTLGCLRCPRTLEKHRYVVDDLPLEYVKSIAENTVYPEVLLCGGLGDPIYHRQFHQALDLFIKNGKKIRITTAGSHRPAEWWRETAAMLATSPGAVVQFSIDGLEDTNPLYRINSKWSSIMDAVKACQDAGVRTIWKFIVFKHNQHQIEEAREMATAMGMKFEPSLSGRWGEKFGFTWDTDPLRPDEKFTSQMKAGLVKPSG